MLLLELVRELPMLFTYDHSLWQSQTLKCISQLPVTLANTNCSAKYTTSQQYCLLLPLNARFHVISQRGLLYLPKILTTLPEVLSSWYTTQNKQTVQNKSTINVENGYITQTIDQEAEDFIHFQVNIILSPTIAMHAVTTIIARKIKFLK